jgi:CDP-diacylglycerol--glycerol-3-phosphate 3-phosphatidyltransferase
VASAAITGSLLVSYTRARGESVGVLCKEGLMQRAERLVLTFLVCLLDAPITAATGRPSGTAVLWVLALIAIGTFATAIQRTFWISARLREKGPAGR